MRRGELAAARHRARGASDHGRIFEEDHTGANSRIQRGVERSALEIIWNASLTVFWLLNSSGGMSPTIRTMFLTPACASILDSIRMRQLVCPAAAHILSATARTRHELAAAGPALPSAHPVRSRLTALRSQLARLVGGVRRAFRRRG